MDRTIVKNSQAIPEGIELRRNNAVRIHFMYRGIRCREHLKLEPTKANLKYCANLRAEILNKIARNEFDYSHYFPDSKFAKRLGIIEAVEVIYCQTLLEKQIANYESMVANGNMSPSTLNGYRKIITGHLMPTLGRHNILEITPPVIREWISTLQATPKTIRNCLTPLRHLFDDAMNDGIIKESPMKQLALSKLIAIVAKNQNSMLNRLMKKKSKLL